MMRMSGSTRRWHSTSAATADERQGARPPAVRIATVWCRVIRFSWLRRISAGAGVRSRPVPGRDRTADRALHSGISANLDSPMRIRRPLLLAVLGVLLMARGVIAQAEGDRHALAAWID